ncbi:MAG: hypothetical protein QM780_17020 [Hyphomicrobium sp.]|uniref:hypothetical protein n=1 Tax=Hyphomicrobium sp. TaxID=82 RepID=UPI0039E4EA4E
MQHVTKTYTSCKAMPFVLGSREAHRSCSEIRDWRIQMLLVIEHLVEVIEGLFYPSRRRFGGKR